MMIPIEMISSLSFYGLATLFIKAGIILIISYSLYEQFELSPASTRHNIWLLSFISLALLPLLAIILPPIEWAILQPENDSQSSNTHSHPLVSINSLLLIYLAVLIIKLLRLFFEVFNIAWISGQASAASSDWQDKIHILSSRKASIKISSQIDSPMTWGALSPVILLPERSLHWSPDDIAMVLSHELAHIERNDWLSQLLAQLVCILYWPVPGIQSVLKHLSLEAERSADDKVLSQGNQAPDYAGLLVKQARTTKLMASVALGKPSELNLRVKHIISTCVDRSHTATARRLLLSLCWLSLIPLAAIKATAKTDSDSDWNYQSLPFHKPQQQSEPPLIKEIEIKKPNKPAPAVKPPKTRFTYQHSLRKQDESNEAPKPFDKKPNVTRNHVNQPKIQLISSTLPSYPPRAIKKGLEAKIVIEYDINTSGKPFNLRLISNNSSPIFTKAVFKAITNYRYQPFYLNQEAINLVNVQERFQFNLSDKKQNNITNHARASP